MPPGLLFLSGSNSSAPVHGHWEHERVTKCQMCSGPANRALWLHKHQINIGQQCDIPNIGQPALQSIDDANLGQEALSPEDMAVYESTEFGYGEIWSGAADGFEIEDLLDSLFVLE